MHIQTNLALLAFGLVTRATQLFANRGTIPGTGIGVWNDFIHENQGTIQQVSNIFYKGDSSIKATQVWDYNWYAAGNRFHSEADVFDGYKFNDERFYGFAFRLQQDWPVNETRSMNIAQFISDFRDYKNLKCDDWIPTSMVWLEGDKLYTRTKYWVNNDPNNHSSPNNGICHQVTSAKIPAGTVIPGVWHTVVIQAKWKSDNTGYYKLWLDGVNSVHQFDLPTTFDDPTHQFAFHVGIYANGWKDHPPGPNDSDTRQIWFDQVAVGTTFADVDPTQWT